MKKTSLAADSVAGSATLGGTPNLSLVSPMPAFGHYDRGQVIKRLFDFLFAFVAIVLLSPVLLFIALAVIFTSRGSAIFTQRRVGKDGRVFNFYKFRSMQANNDETIHKAYFEKLIRGRREKECGDSFKIKNDPRVTPIGRFLRKTSLDELPQLFNVLKGEMSLVGPRPPIDYEVEQYQDWHRQRLHALPGITGLWQVSGRSSVPFDEMVLLDIHYMEHWTLILDFKIIFRTIPVVLFGIGAY